MPITLPNIITIIVLAVGKIINISSIIVVAIGKIQRVSEKYFPIKKFLVSSPRPPGNQTTKLYPKNVSFKNPLSEVFYSGTSLKLKMILCIPKIVSRKTVSLFSGTPPAFH